MNTSEAPALARGLLLAIVGLALMSSGCMAVAAGVVGGVAGAAGYDYFTSKSSPVTSASQSP